MPRVNSLPVLSVSLLVATLPLYLIRLTIFGIPTTVWELLLYAVFAWFAIQRLLSAKIILRDPLRLPLGLLVIAGLIGALINPDLRAGLGQWKALILDPILLYGLCRTIIRSEKEKLSLIYGLIIGGTLVALEGISIARFIASQMSQDQRLIGLYALDSGASPNYLALYLAPLTVLAAILTLKVVFRERKMNLHLGLLILATISMATALLATDSRGGILAALGGLLGGSMILAIQAWSQLRRQITLGIIGLVALIGLLFGPQFRVEVTTPSADRLATSNNVRAQIWSTTLLKVIPAGSFWGSGFGNYQIVFGDLTKAEINYPEFITPYALHPHNFWLTTWVHLGFFGVVAWLALIVAVVRRGAWLTSFQAAIAAALITWFLHGLIDTTYYKNDLAVLALALVALALSENIRKSYPADQ